MMTVKPGPFFFSSSFFTSQQFLTLQLKSQEKACAIELEDSSVPIFYIFVACADNDIVVFFEDKIFCSFKIYID